MLLHYGYIIPIPIPLACAECDSSLLFSGTIALVLSITYIYIYEDASQFLYTSRERFWCNSRSWYCNWNSVYCFLLTYAFSFQCRIMVLAALFVPCFLQVVCFWNRDVYQICSIGSFICESYIWMVLGLVLFVKKLWSQ
jgi:hypothetical protein